MQYTSDVILPFIRANARTNLTTLSRQTGIPVSTIFDRIRTYDGTIIKRFTALLDFAAIGFPIHAKILLKVEPTHRQAVKTYLAGHERVNSVWRVNNGFDYAAECFFTTIMEAEDFIDNIEQHHRILDKLVLHVIDEIATENMLTIQKGNAKHA